MSARLTPKQKRQEANTKIVGGASVAAGAGATAPVIRTGRKSPTEMTGASPKMQAGRYQGELVDAMRAGKVNSNSTLRVLKTPSGRYLNAGGTHRHLAREAMGQPTKKIKVAELAFEPRHSLIDEVLVRRNIGELKRGSKKAVAGKNKPVSDWARKQNKVLAAAADKNDDANWRAMKATGGRDIAPLHRMQTRSGIAVAGLAGAAGLGLAAKGIHDRKKLGKVRKSMNGHDAFEVSKAKGRQSSPGRVATGAFFPGIHGAIAGKKGRKAEAAAWEIGGSLLGSVPGAAVGTHLAAKRGHYKPLPAKSKKVSKAAGTTEIAASEKKPGKKVEAAYPPEVKAYIAEHGKSGKSGKSAHAAFADEEIEKAFLSALKLPSAVGQAGKAVGGAMKSGAQRAGVMRGPGSTIAGGPGAAAMKGKVGTMSTTSQGGTWALKPKTTKTFTPRRGGGAPTKTVTGGGLTTKGKVAVGGVGGAGAFGAGAAMPRKNKNQY